MIFGKAIDLAITENLKKNKKFLLMGLGVSYDNKDFFKEFPRQVIETPVSELSFTGMAVGLGSQKYFPMIDHGRVEFSMLAFDQIFTQAARWEFMFGGNYPCTPCFKICIGRQWGNGPQHTGTYHSMFMQSLGMDIFIPSTPFEAYLHVKNILKQKRPSTILEHRWLYLNDQTFKPKNSKKVHRAILEENGKENIIVTYGDGFSESLKAKQILEINGIKVSVMSISYFPSHERISPNIINTLKKYKNIFYVDTSPFEFGVLNGLSGILNNAFKKRNLIETIISCPKTPCPTSPKLAEKYYPTKNDISNKIYKKLTGKNLRLKKIDFYEIHTVSKVNLDKLLKNYKFLF